MFEPELVEDCRKALGLHHSSSCGQSPFVEPVSPCSCGAEKETRRILHAVAPLLAAQQPSVARSVEAALVDALVGGNGFLQIRHLPPGMVSLGAEAEQVWDGNTDKLYE